MLKSIHAHLAATLIAPDWSDIEMAEDIDRLGEMIGLMHGTGAIILPYRERADAQSLASGGFRQRITVQFITVIVQNEPVGLLGAERAGRFDVLKQQLETALAGWEPSGCIQPCELVDGESSPFSPGVSFYLHTWQTARFLTGA